MRSVIESISRRRHLLSRLRLASLQAADGGVLNPGRSADLNGETTIQFTTKARFISAFYHSSCQNNSSISAVPRSKRGDRRRNSWFQSKDRLLSLENGSFRDNHWNEALALLRRFPDERMSKESIEGAFLLLDRLSAEMNPARQPIPNDIVQRILESWLHFVESSTPKQSLAHLSPEILKARIVKYTVSGVVHPSRVLHLHNVVLRGVGMQNNQKAMEYVGWMNANGIEPDSMIYQTLMSVVVSGNGDARLVENIFNKMKSAYEEGQTDMKPKRKALAIRLQSWSREGNPEMATLALRDMIFSDDDACHPHWRDFHSVLQAWGHSKHPQAAHKAEECLRLMQKLSSRLDCAPNEFTYNQVINNYVRSSQPGSIERAEELLVEMQQQGLKPDAAAFNSIMSYYAKARSAKSLRRVEQLDQEMVRLAVKRTATTYTSLMNAYARNDRIEEMELLFQEMKSRFQEGDQTVKPPYTAHILRLQTYSKMGDADMATMALSEIIAKSKPGGYLDRKPATHEFSTVIEAWARSGRAEAADKAEAGLRQMIKLSQDGEYNCHPNAFSFTAVLLAHCKSNPSPSSSSGRRALAVFNQLKELSEKDPANKLLRPMFVTYAYVSLCLILSEDETASRTLQDLLHELRAKDKHFWIASDSVDYQAISVVSALQKSNIGNKHDLIEQFKQLKEIGLQFKED